MPATTHDEAPGHDEHEDVVRLDRGPGGGALLEQPLVVASGADDPLARAHEHTAPEALESFLDSVAPRRVWNGGGAVSYPAMTDTGTMFFREGPAIEPDRCGCGTVHDHGSEVSDELDCACGQVHVDVDPEPDPIPKPVVVPPPPQPVVVLEPVPEPVLGHWSIVRAGTGYALAPRLDGAQRRFDEMVRAWQALRDPIDFEADLAAVAESLTHFDPEVYPLWMPVSLWTRYGTHLLSDPGFRPTEADVCEELEQMLDFSRRSAM